MCLVAPGQHLSPQRSGPLLLESGKLDPCPLFYGSCAPCPRWPQRGRDSQIPKSKTQEWLCELAHLGEPEDSNQEIKRYAKWRWPGMSIHWSVKILNLIIINSFSKQLSMGCNMGAKKMQHGSQIPAVIVLLVPWNWIYALNKHCLVAYCVPVILWILGSLQRSKDRLGMSPALNIHYRVPAVCGTQCCVLGYRDQENRPHLCFQGTYSWEEETDFNWWIINIENSEFL